MLIEYKVKFDKEGFTLTQRLESGVQAIPKVLSPADVAVQNNLPAVVDGPPVAPAAGVPAEAQNNNQDGGGPVDPPSGVGSGGNGAGSSPVTVIGPFIFTYPHPPQSESKSGSKG